MRPVADDGRWADAAREEILRHWYSTYYAKVAGSANGSAFQRYMHSAMERLLSRDVHLPRVLEVGGNTGEHVPFVQHSYDQYVLTDITRPGEGVGSMPGAAVFGAQCDVGRLPFQDASFDRVIATCLLHHVVDPLAALREMRRVATPQHGLVTILLPTDPGLAYRAGKRLTSDRLARRHGVQQLHRLVAAIDHRNHFLSVRRQVAHVFRHDSCAFDFRPWRFPSWNMNAFVVVHVTLGGAAPTRSAERNAATL